MIQSGGSHFLDLIIIAQKMKFSIKDFFPFCAVNSAEAMYKIANKVNDLSNENSLGKIDKIIKTVDYLQKTNARF